MAREYQQYQILCSDESAYHGVNEDGTVGKWYDTRELQPVSSRYFDDQNNDQRFAGIKHKREG